ncbi:Sas10/Utp3/C1D family-domain-containing protein [Melanogaster broomeanus]|nr:Sas10/Utp3/C1D family-domain-containing protein [Melanogaster broomeanus]
MIDSTQIRSRLAKLNKSLDELESQLEPLFSQSLPETLLGLDTIQQAKLQVIIPYVVYDLVFVYLKSRGVDPKTHPVVNELERIRQYFDKIKDAEESDQKRKVGIDKAAAGRFIKHAIAQAKNARLVEEELAEDAAAPVVASTSSSERVPVKVTSKMLARAEYEKEMKDLGSEEDEDLEVFNDDEAAAVDDDDEEQSSRVDQASASRRKRPRMDPFSGEDPCPLLELSVIVSRCLTGYEDVSIPKQTADNNKKAKLYSTDRSSGK